jgi:putative heme iron utilization protein
VPGLRLTDTEDLRRFAEAIMRKKLRTWYKESMAKHREDYDQVFQAASLDGENCLAEIPGLGMP